MTKKTINTKISFMLSDVNYNYFSKTALFTLYLPLYMNT